MSLAKKCYIRGGSGCNLHDKVMKQLKGTTLNIIEWNDRCRHTMKNHRMRGNTWIREFSDQGFCILKGSLSSDIRHEAVKEVDQRENFKLSAHSVKLSGMFFFFPCSSMTRSCTWFQIVGCYWGWHLWAYCFSWRNYLCCVASRSFKLRP